MVSEALRTKKTLTLYKAYKMKNGETMKIDPRKESFYLTEKTAVAALLESMVDFTKEDPMEPLNALVGDTVHILKVVIYTTRIPEDDWKSEIIQEGDEVRLPLEKYQKTMNITPVVISSFEAKPNKTDPQKLDVTKVVFSK